MKIEFTKMSGAGNDFIFLAPEYSFLKERLKSVARQLCARRTSIGADGLVMVEKNAAEILMHYFNSDGGEASFCGNGSRCLVLYCNVKGIQRGLVRFRSGSGVHTGEVVAGGISISMKLPVLLEEISIDLDGVIYQVALVDSGVPHAVVVTKAVASLDVETIGHKIRHDPAFGDVGANVDFLDPVASPTFKVRTYERGVERETLACGSGCVACAHLLRQKNQAGDIVRLRVASGDTLEVRFSQAEGEDKVHLVGPARIVYEGEIELEEKNNV